MGFIGFRAYRVYRVSGLEEQAEFWDAGIFGCAVVFEGAVQRGLKA